MGMYERPQMTATEWLVIRENNINGDARFLPWMNPPFVAIPFAMLAIMPYRAAAMFWLALNIVPRRHVALAAASHVAQGVFAAAHAFLIWLAISMSMPFWQAMYAQQNTFVSLVLLCVVARCWLSGRGFWAGALWGSCCLSPQLAMVIAAVLGISMGAVAMTGFCLVAFGLVGLSVWGMHGTLTA